MINFGGITLRQVNVALVLLPFFLGFQHARGSESFVCAGDTLYKPDGSYVYVGFDACEKAKVLDQLACVNGSLYFANGGTYYLGSSACDNARVSPSFICSGTHLYHRSGWSQFVGSGCVGVIFAGDVACASGMLFRSNGSSVYVGTTGCRDFRPR